MPTVRLLVLSALALQLPLAAQDAATSLLRRLTLEERAAQLMMSWTLAAPDAPARAELLRQVEEVGIGGVVLSLGTSAEAVAWVEELQARAAIPLIVAGDFENGLAFRLSDATDLGSQMLLGATGSAGLAREAGIVTGLESRAIGVHWDFAPVLDVQVNPSNPIIQIRSFGEDPALVTRLGIAWMLGLQSTGVLATGKHFPGHGDVATDSHHELPVVPGDRERLEQVELMPFRAAIEAGIASLMTGHLSVAGLGEDPAVPATLSPKIMTGLLREELGFDGILSTDALTMGGLKGFEPTEATVRALAAGSDLLLMPPDPLAARDAIVAAIRDGTLPQSRLDEACLRILRAKERCGLLHGAGMPAADWPDVVHAASHRALADRIAARGVTLAVDPHGVLPIANDRELVVVTLATGDDDAGAAFVRALADGVDDVRAFRVGRGGSRGRADDAVVAVQGAAERGAGVVLAIAHGRQGRVPPSFATLVEAAPPGSVVVVLGNPFVAGAMPAEAAVLLGYGTSEHIEAAAARAILGTSPIVGRAPVSVPGLCERGAGLTWLPPSTELPVVAPEDEGFAPNLAARVRTLLEQSVEERVFPGAVVAVARRGRLVAEVAVGTETYAEDAPPVRPDSLFDLASLTKVCATTPAILVLVDRGELTLDTKVQELVPAFTGDGKDRVLIRHLLTHTAGLPPFRRFFEKLSGKAEILAAAAAEPLESAPGERYRYSDIGMMLAMACVEAVTDVPFAEFVDREVFGPLGMESAVFSSSGSPIDAVPTEDDPWRGRVVRGEVHDENAFAMGGVSGHAGLFANARDVTRLGQAFLGGGRGLASPGLVREFVRRQDVVEGSSRALGWDTSRPPGPEGSMPSRRWFGHTGFTGTSIWCDPALDLSIVLLANRVHPTRENQGHVRVRRELADLVVGLLDP